MVDVLKVKAMEEVDPLFDRLLEVAVSETVSSIVMTHYLMLDRCPTWEKSAGTPAELVHFEHSGLENFDVVPEQTSCSCCCEPKNHPG